HVQIETIFPRPTFDWSSFNLEQINSSPCERLKRAVARAGLMRKLDDERELVGVFGKIFVRRWQKKARVVFATVLQMLAQNHPAVFLSGAPSSNGCARKVALSDDSCDAARCIFCRNAFDLRIRSQESPALIEGDRVGFNGGDHLES